MRTERKELSENDGLFAGPLMAPPIPFRSFLNKKNGRLLMRYSHPAGGMGSGLLGVSHHLACHRLDSSKILEKLRWPFLPGSPKTAPMGHESFGRWRYRSSYKPYSTSGYGTCWKMEKLNRTQDLFMQFASILTVLLEHGVLFG